METFNLNYKQIPDGFCVIRIKESNNYLHIKNGYVYFNDKMHGCFVVSQEVAEEMILDIERIVEYSVEIVDFQEAYKEHGIVEKQIKYN